MKKNFVIVIFLVVLFFFTSCDEQSKAEKSVSNFIEKFSLNPETYEPIEFINLEKTDKGYRLGHMYRIMNRSGIKEIRNHTFKLTPDFKVYIEPFEYFD